MCGPPYVHKKYFGTIFLFNWYQNLAVYTVFFYKNREICNEAGLFLIFWGVLRFSAWNVLKLFLIKHIKNIRLVYYYVLICLIKNNLRTFQAENLKIPQKNQKQSCLVSDYVSYKKTVYTAISFDNKKIVPI